MTKILLTEDDHTLRAFLTTSLRRAGHEVREHEDGESALESLEREVFDFLVTDIVMPGMDGIELAQKAIKIDPEIKIVFITGFAAIALAAQAPTPAGSKVLSKPFHLRELVDQLEHLIAA